MTSNFKSLKNDKMYIKTNDELEDIINSDFKGDYKIPEYKIPADIKKEIEEEKKEQENKNLIYKEDVMINPNINTNDVSILGALYY